MRISSYQIALSPHICVGCANHRECCYNHIMSVILLLLFGLRCKLKEELKCRQYFGLSVNFFHSPAKLTDHVTKMHLKILRFERVVVFYLQAMPVLLGLTLYTTIAIWTGE